MSSGKNENERLREENMLLTSKLQHFEDNVKRLTSRHSDFKETDPDFLNDSDT